MSLWARLRRGSSRGERSAADWYAAGSPLPDEERRVEGLAFELAQVLWIQGHRSARPWAERQALLERVVTSPRWWDAGYRWSASDAECRVTDAAGTVLVKVRHEPAGDGHVIERYEDGELVRRDAYEQDGRVSGR